MDESGQAAANQSQRQTPTSGPAPADDEVRLAAEIDAPATPSLPPARFAVGDHVVGGGHGVDRPVYGHRRTAQGELLQFSPGGPWLPAQDFEVRPT